MPPPRLPGAGAVSFPERGTAEQAGRTLSRVTPVAGEARVAEIARMLVELFHRDAAPDYRWEMFDPVS